jgi:hypothetical protein
MVGGPGCLKILRKNMNMKNERNCLQRQMEGFAKLMQIGGVVNRCR